MTVTKRHQHLPAMSNVRIMDTKCLSALYEDNPKLQVFNHEIQYDGSQSLNNKIYVHIADITEVLVDAIVCSTQTDLHLEPIGLCKSVWGRGGQELREHCRQIGQCHEGDAFLTQGFDLPVRYIIHTAGPPPDTPLSYEERKQCLRQNYWSSLQKVGETADIRSVAFPCIGSGGAGIKLNHAINIAVTTLRQWLDTGDNHTKVDHILLCMYNDEQWQEYFPQLLDMFPYGKDCAGFDLESLPKVTVTDLRVPSGIHQSNVSNIFCIKYKSGLKRTLKVYFHALVNACLEKVGRFPPPSGSLIRFQSCARFELCLPNHYCILNHTQCSNFTAIEIQVINLSQDPNTLKGDICRHVKEEVANYLESLFDNVDAPKMCVRCRNSSWAMEEGLWELDKLMAVEGLPSACNHQRFQDTHQVWSRDLLYLWTGSENSANSNQSLVSASRQPVEHGESLYDQNDTSTSREGQEGSWSLVTEQSDNSMSYSTAVKSDTTSETLADNNEIVQTHKKTSRGILGIFKNIFIKDPKSSTLLSTSSATGGALNTGKTNTRAVEARAETTTVNTIPAPSISMSSSQSSSALNIASGVENFLVVPPVTHGVFRHGRSQSESWQHEKYEQFVEVSRKTCSSPGVESEGTLSDSVLMDASRIMGNKQLELGIQLNLGHAQVQRIIGEHPLNLVMQGFYILNSWKINQKQRGQQPSLEILLEEMDHCEIDTETLRQKYDIPWK